MRSFAGVAAVVLLVSFATGAWGAIPTVEATVDEVAYIGVPVTVSATVSADADLSYVRVYHKPEGARKYAGYVAMELADGVYSVVFPPTEGAQEGAFTGYVRARDVRGRVGKSEAFTVTVQRDVEGPTMSATVPEMIIQGTQLTVEADANDPTGVSKVCFMFRPQGSDVFAKIDLSGEGERWTGTLPGAFIGGVAGVFDYMFSALDGAGNIAESSTGSLEVISDPNPPSVVAPEYKDVPALEPLTIEVEITDDNGVASAVLSWAIKDGDTGSADMTHASGDTWTAVVPAAAFEQGNKVKLTVVAVDIAGNRASFELKEIKIKKPRGSIRGG
jgi:hypothetical protein